MDYLNSEPFWKLLAISACGLVISGIIFWLQVGSKMPTEEAVKTIVRETSPYVEDREFLRRSAEMTFENNEVIGEIKQKVVKLETQVEGIDKNVERILDMQLAKNKVAHAD